MLSTAHLKVDAGAEAVFAAELVVQLDLLLPVGLLATRLHDHDWWTGGQVDM